MSMIFKPIHSPGRNEKETGGRGRAGCHSTPKGGISSNTNEHQLILLDYFLQREGLDKLEENKRKKESNLRLMDSSFGATEKFLCHLHGI